MKLLTISNCPLAPQQGSGYVTLGFVEGLRSRGWSVDAFGPEHLEPWPGLRRARSWRMALGMLRQAQRCLSKTDYDVVEFYGGEAWLALSVLSRRANRDFLLVSHSNGLEPFAGEQLRLHLGADTLDGGQRRWYQLDAHALIAEGFRKADGLVTVSEFERRYASEHRYQPEERLLAIENSLPESFNSLPVQFDRKPLIVFCGSWIPRKGTRLIVEDISRVLREFPDSRLRLIGVGNAFRVGEHFPADVQQRVEVLPFVSDKAQLRAAYAECAIAISPSAYESFGLTTAEAMACGCAMVASRTGFAAILRDGVEACLLDAASSPHLYSQVKRLLEDPTARSKIAAAGYARVQRLKWNGAVDTLSAAYQTWLADRRAVQLRQQRA